MEKIAKHFYLAKENVIKRKIIIPEYKNKRKSLTDVINSLPDSPNKKFKYNQYTNLAYKALFGLNSKQIKTARCADPDKSATECLSSEEIKKLSLLQEKIAMLIELDLSYEEIKNILNKKYSCTGE